MKTFFTLLLLVILVLSCKKGQSDLSIAITLSNVSYGGQVEGATVSVKKVVSGTGDVVSVGTYTSNASGQVVFSTKRDKFDYLIVQVEKSNFFSIEEKIYMSDLNANDLNSINYDLVGKSWAAIHLKATGPSSVNIQKNAGKSGCEECCPSVMTYFAGPIDTTFSSTRRSYPCQAGILHQYFSRLPYSVDIGCRSGRTFVGGQDTERRSAPDAHADSAECEHSSASGQSDSGFP